MITTNHIKPDWRTRVKQFFELGFWKYKKLKEGTLGNLHYKYFYTTYFSIPEEFYSDKIILDVGCGPRGSLEWAEMARQRIGIDPLADRYGELGATGHRMDYIKGHSEQLPFEDGKFDIVSSFNALDHVRDIDATCRELERVLKPGGLLLLIVDIHPRATLTEPQILGWDLIDRYFSNFRVLEQQKLESVHRGKIYKNLRSRVPLKRNRARRGVLTVKLQKFP